MTANPLDGIVDDPVRGRPAARAAVGGEWAAATALTRLDDTRFAGHVGEDWTSLQGVHGGIVAALMTNASAAVLRDIGADPATQLRAATFGYMRGNVVGDLVIDVEVMRRGRAMITTHVQVEQDGKATTVARLHHSTPWEGLEYSDVPAPSPRPAGATLLSIPGPAHINNTETYLDPDTGFLSGAARSEWRAWGRPAHGSTFDTAWLTMYGDYFPPAAFARSTVPVRAVTIEYSIQIHSAAGMWTLPDDGFLAAMMHTFHSHDGFAVEDGWLHLPDGALLATIRQTRLAG